MSYGYLVAVTKEDPSIEKSRYCKFFKVAEISNLIFYTRLEEGNVLMVRNEKFYTLNEQGIKFLEKIERPLYFMCFLLGGKEGDADMVNRAKKQIESIMVVPKTHLTKIERLEINQTYEIIP